MSHRSSHLYLPGTVEAVAHARRAVAGTMRGWGFSDSGWLDTVSLIVTELVSNAVRHAGGRITLDLRVNGEMVLGVTDSSPARPRVIAPDDAGGRGMIIIDALCPRWGVHEHESGKRIWVELPHFPEGPQR